MPLYSYAPILDIVKDACKRLNLVVPTGVYDSNDENAIIMGAIANEIGVMLQDLHSWQQFVKVFTITGDGIETGFDLPTDFRKFTDTTGWSKTNRRPVMILNAQNWAAVQAYVSQSVFITPACRIFDDQLQFLVAPADGEIITFEYMSRNWVISGADPLILQNVLKVNSDTPMHDMTLFNQMLRIKWLEVRGMPTESVQNDFNTRFSQVTGYNQLANPLMLQGGNLGDFRLLTGANLPNTGYG